MHHQKRSLGQCENIPVQCQTFDGCEKKINPERKNCYKAKILNHTDGGENEAKKGMWEVS